MGTLLLRYKNSLCQRRTALFGSGPGQGQLICPANAAPDDIVRPAHWRENASLLRQGYSIFTLFPQHMGGIA